jgi:hypothetical protein
VLTGCGGSSNSSSSTAASSPASAAASSSLNSAHIAYAIEQSILAQRHIHAQVTCPASIPKRKGRKFVCIARSKAGQTPFVVTEINNQGNVTYVGK